MKKEDTKFITPLAGCMEILTKFTYELLSTVFYKDEPAMKEETLNEYRINCSKRMVDLLQNDSTQTDKLTDALDEFVNELFSVEATTTDKDKYFESGKDYKLKKNTYLKREQLTNAIYKLAEELGKYAKDKHLDYVKDSSSFIYDYEMEASILFQEFQFYLFNLNNANALDMNYFKRYKNVVSESYFQLYSTSKTDSVSYLVRNKKGEILSTESDEGLELVLTSSPQNLEMYKKLSFTKHDGIRAIANKEELALLRSEIIKLKNDKVNGKEEKKQEVKETKKKEIQNAQSKKKSVQKDVKKLVPDKKYKKNLNLNSIFDSVSLSGFLLSILPTLLMITYLILLVTGVMDQITFSSSSFSGTLFGYDFELSGLMANWLENTDHGFFSAITLGIIQVVLILVGFILDLIIHLAFLILAILWFVFILIFSMCLYYVFPVAIAVLTIIHFFRSDEDNKLVTGICMGVSIICCISYFLIGMNVI